MSESYGLIKTVNLNSKLESLKLSFWPGLIPLKQRWRNNGLSADFLADYVTTFFPLDDSDPRTQQRQIEIRGAVSYIANELLENAMKFHAADVAQPISMVLYLHRETVLFQETNAITNADAHRFRQYITLLQSSEPSELYIQQLESNAVSENSAGMGILTMINDYAAELAWRFDPIDDEGCLVTTQVEIKI